MRKQYKFSKLAKAYYEAYRRKAFYNFSGHPVLEDVSFEEMCWSGQRYFRQFAKAIANGMTIKQINALTKSIETWPSMSDQEL